MSEVEIPYDEGYVDPAELGAELQHVRESLTRVWLHAADGDDPVTLALLLKDVGGVKKLLAECYAAIETTFMACAGEKVTMTPAGPFEIVKKKKRTGWRNDELSNEVVRVAHAEGTDPLALYMECARPSWRTTALRAHGIQVDEWCVEEDDGFSVRLPPSDLEESF